MDREIVLALVAIAPQVLVLLVIVVGALVFRGQIGKTIGGRVTSVSVFGLRMDLNAEAVDRAVAEKAAAFDSTPTRKPFAGRPSASSDQVVDAGRSLRGASPRSNDPVGRRSAREQPHRAPAAPSDGHLRRGRDLKCGGDGGPRRSG